LDRPGMPDRFEHDVRAESVGRIADERAEIIARWIDDDGGAEGTGQISPVGPWLRDNHRARTGGLLDGRDEKADRSAADDADSVARAELRAIDGAHRARKRLGQGADPIRHRVWQAEDILLADDAGRRPGAALQTAPIRTGVPATGAAEHARPTGRVRDRGD